MCTTDLRRSRGHWVSTSRTTLLTPTTIVEKKGTKRRAPVSSGISEPGVLHLPSFVFSSPAMPWIGSSLTIYVITCHRSLFLSSLYPSLLPQFYADLFVPTSPHKFSFSVNEVSRLRFQPKLASKLFSIIDAPSILSF